MVNYCLFINLMCLFFTEEKITVIMLTYMQDETLIPFLFSSYKRDVNHFKMLRWQAADTGLVKDNKTR